MGAAESSNSPAAGAANVNYALGTMRASLLDAKHIATLTWPEFVSIVSQVNIR
jgi:hypothetical protein